MRQRFFYLFVLATFICIGYVTCILLWGQGEVSYRNITVFG